MLLFSTRTLPALGVERRVTLAAPWSAGLSPASLGGLKPALRSQTAKCVGSTSHLAGGAGELSRPLGRMALDERH